MGTPPQYVARKIAEKGLKSAALHGLSASLETGAPGMKLQWTACTCRSSCWA